MDKSEQPEPSQPGSHRAPRRIRVIRALGRMSIGGVQRGLLATLARADHERFEYAVLCTKKRGLWAGAVEELGLSLYCRKTVPPWNPYRILKLAMLLRSLRPELIHIHMASSVIPVGTAALLAGVRHTVIQHHNEYTRHWEDLGPRLRRWEHWLTRRADAIIGVSEAVARTTEEQVGLPSGSVHVVPNGLDRMKIHGAEPYDPRAEWGLAAGRPLVVHVARFVPTKRINDFIDAAAQILGRWPSRHPERAAPAFIIIGGRSDKLGERYRAQIAGYGMERDIILAGSRNDVPSLIKTAQVGALASEMEGFGQVILEYVAAGLPVAATNLPCIAEMLRDGREALLTPTRDPAALASSIERLLVEREYAQQLNAAAQQRLGLYEWERAVRSYESIYEKVLERKATGRR